MVNVRPWLPTCSEKKAMNSHGRSEFCNGPTKHSPLAVLPLRAREARVIAGALASFPKFAFSDAMEADPLGDVLLEWAAADCLPTQSSADGSVFAHAVNGCERFRMCAEILRKLRSRLLL